MRHNQGQISGIQVTVRGAARKTRRDADIPVPPRAARGKTRAPSTSKPRRETVPGAAVAVTSTADTAFAAMSRHSARRVHSIISLSLCSLLCVVACIYAAPSSIRSDVAGGVDLAHLCLSWLQSAMIIIAALMVHTYTACTWCATVILNAGHTGVATPHCFAFSIIVGLCLLVASIWWWRATIVKLRQVEAKLQEEEKLSGEKSLTSHAEED